MKRKRHTPESLWDLLDRRDAHECWPWMGNRSSEGYGRVVVGGVLCYAHRVIFDLANPGQIELRAPKDPNAFGFLRHRCDNPCCCNPTHLVVGTHAENMQDKVERGRQWRPIGVKHHRSRLTEDDVREIRAQRNAGMKRKDVANQFGISISAVKRITSGRSYSEIT